MLPGSAAWPGATGAEQVLPGGVRRWAIAAMCTVPSATVEENQVCRVIASQRAADTEELEHGLSRVE